MKVLVTGGTGFLGTALVQTLKSSGHEVILTTRRQENIAEGIFNLGDISADTNWAHLLQGATPSFILREGHIFSMMTHRMH